MHFPARLLPLAACLAAVACPAVAQDILVRARTIVLTPDTVLTDGAFLVRGGKVAYVGAEIPAEARANARVLDLGDATVTPGFVNAHSWLDQEQDLTEMATTSTPALRTAEAFDPFQDALGRMAEAGITSAAFAPSSRNVLGGIAALVKPGNGAGTVADADLYLKAAVVPAARDQERPPTSLMGGAEMLRAALVAARAPVVSLDLQPLRQCVQRGRTLFVHAESHAELTTALGLCREAGLEPVLIGAAEADLCLAEIRAGSARVVLDPLSLDSKTRQLTLPATLATQGIRFAFATNDPSQLRLTAALAVRNGLPRTTALDALTRAPAELLGLAARIGSLRAGCDADFAVWSGDPIDLTSRLIAVHIGGIEVHPPRSTGGAKAANGAHR